MTVDVRKSIKETIGDDGGTRVDAVLSKVGAEHGPDEAEHVFERMKKQGEVYVVPRDDGADVAKVTGR